MQHAWRRPPRLVGHRGAPLRAPENTPAAFRAALAEGADGIELDVRLSRDREVVVHHDAQLGRVLPGQAFVHEADMDALARAGVPRLADVLRDFPDTPLDVEVKADADDARELARRVAEVVEDARALDRVLVTSFEPEVVDDYARRTGRPVGGIHAWAPEAEDVAAWPRLTHHALAVEAATEGAVRALLDAERVVLAWTVNDVAAARRLLALGVASLVTDRPGLLRARLRRGAPAR